MSRKTKSEGLFERFCDEQKIRWQRLPEGEKRQPDYEVFPAEQRVVVEVKEIAATENERAVLRGEAKTYGGEPGKRYRGKIEEAMGQIRNGSGGVLPCLLVLYNDTGLPNPFLHYEIKVAMYGLEAVTFAAPPDMSAPPFAIDRDFGRRNNKTVSLDKNTELSAVAVLMPEYGHPSGDMILPVYHNIHCRHTFLPDWWKGDRIFHYRLGEREPGQFQEWIAC